MIPRILLALALAPAAALAQYMTVGPNGQLVPAGSTVIIAGQGGGPILTTPSVGFGTPQSSVGISLADRAGISNVAPAPAAIPGTENLSGMAPEQEPAESTGAEAAAAGATGRLINDAGPSYFAGAAFVGGAGPAAAVPPGAASASLGEVAAKYKSGRSPYIRTYTNADAERLSGMTVHGANINPVSAQNTGAAAQQSQVAANQPVQSAQAPQLMAGGRPSPSIRAEGAQSAGNDQGATTPQVNQQAGRQQDNDQDTGTRLPASSTFLPLFGLLGVASGALGLWLKLRG